MAADGRALGVFSALPLFGGTALYRLGTVLFKHRVLGTLSPERPAALVALLALLALGVAGPPLVALAAVVVVLGSLVGVETVRYAEHRRGIRAA